MSLLNRNILRCIAATALSLAALQAQASLTIFTSISESVGSISTSIQKSSESSSNTMTAQGPYEVTDVAEVEGAPEMLRLALRAQQAGADDLKLTLPRKAVTQALIAVGTVIEAQPREYGVAFAVRDTAGQAQPFFLVLEDAWYRELESRPVSL